MPKDGTVHELTSNVSPPSMPLCMDDSFSVSVEMANGARLVALS